MKISPSLSAPLILNHPQLLSGSTVLALSLAAFAPHSFGQSHTPPPSSLPESSPAPLAIDSDHDGISDDLEQSLLVQFAPKFLVGSGDCSNIPAEFQPGNATPLVESENGTIYGQVFPAKDPIDGEPAAEIHYYHLWRIDCGPHGHPLDAEHVSVLVRASNSDLRSATWKALYWYAAAHENTVCDVSQIAHASTLHAEDAGPSVWISPGKHASYLNQALCQKGCGADHCENMAPLRPAKLVNLGEPGYPMNGSVFIASSAWPLSAKMSETNFPAPALARLGELPDSEIAWFNQGKHPRQGIIAISSTTGQAIAGGGRDTISGISTAEDSSGNALHKSYRHTRHALGASAQHVGKALGIENHPAPPKPPPAANTP
ncbi:MAG: hypothetical protein ACLP07_07005 [Terracidiphilus sp.]